MTDTPMPACPVNVTCNACHRNIVGATKPDAWCGALQQCGLRDLQALASQCVTAGTQARDAHEGLAAAEIQRIAKQIGWTNVWSAPQDRRRWFVERPKESAPGTLEATTLEDAINRHSVAGMKPRHSDEWHEDYGPVLWIRYASGEPPQVWAGTPHASDWPGDEFKHWTPIPPWPADLPEDFHPDYPETPTEGAAK